MLKNNTPDTILLHNELQLLMDELSNAKSGTAQALVLKYKIKKLSEKLQEYKSPEFEYNI